MKLKSKRVVYFTLATTLSVNDSRLVSSSDPSERHFLSNEVGPTRKELHLTSRTRAF